MQSLVPRLQQQNCTQVLVTRSEWPLAATGSCLRIYPCVSVCVCVYVRAIFSPIPAPNHTPHQHRSCIEIALCSNGFGFRIQHQKKTYKLSSTVRQGAQFRVPQFSFHSWSFLFPHTLRFGWGTCHRHPSTNLYLCP